MSNEHAEQSEASRYPQVIRTISETPWAILPETMAAIREVVAMRANGHRFTKEEVQARVGDSNARRDLQMAGSVAVIPVYGVITPKADLFSEMSGGTSIERLQSTFAEAVSSQDVSAILLDVASPGGSVGLLPEFAAQVREARGSKPIVAIANTRAASAAYWIASQADEVVVTPSGDVGSIGVFAAHEDISALQEKLGVKTTLIHAGKFKVEGNPFEPLSEEALAEIQARVDETYALFVDDVAAGRGVDASKVEHDFGQGRMLTAKNALSAGMVDRVDTFDATVNRLISESAAAIPAADPAGGSNASGGGRDVQVQIIGKHSHSSSHSHSLTGSPGGSLNGGTSAATNPAAASGRSFADEAASARDATLALVTRARSLAEFRVEGRLTVAKRDQLADVLASLDEAGSEVRELLAATDPERDDTQDDGIGLEAELAFQQIAALNT